MVATTTVVRRRLIEKIAHTGIPGYDAWATAAKGDHFDHEAAQRAADFFPACLTHQTGSRFAGKPLKLERWQLAVVYNIFGWKQADGLRRYRECYLTVARKNGKTTWIAGLGVLIFFCDGEPGAEVYCAAAERGQANILLSVAKGMVTSCPALMEHATILQHRITFEANNSFFTAISAEARSKHGFNGYAILIDELHAIRDRELVDVLTTSTGAREQPIIMHLTTAGFDRTTICFEKYTYAKKVRDGFLKDRAFLPVIYELEEDDDWTDPKLWGKANPNLRVSVSMEYLERECERAKTTPGYQNVFRRLHCNQWTQQANRWLPMDRWDGLCGGQIDEESLAGRRCWAGIDVSSTTDLTVICLLFEPEEDGGPYEAIWRCFCPEDHPAAKSRGEKESYREWIDTGHLIATPGDTIDHSRVRATMTELGELYDIVEVAIDRWDSTHLQTDLMDDGFDVVKFGQGFGSMAAPTKELEVLVLKGGIRHGGNPVARWAANNVAVDQDAAGNLKPTKSKSSGRIDPIVGLIMALGRAMLDEGGGSVYDNRGMVTL